MTSRLKISYNKEIVDKLMNKLSIKNKHEVPKIEKIILNMGLGEDASDGKKLKACVDDMALIAGQKPVVTKFKQSISNWIVERRFPSIDSCWPLMPVICNFIFYPLVFPLCVYNVFLYRTYMPDNYTTIP